MPNGPWGSSSTPASITPTFIDIVGGASPTWGSITGPVSAATALYAVFAPLVSPAFTGTVTGITASMVGALASGGTAADSSKLGGQLPAYYYQASNPSGFQTAAQVTAALTWGSITGASAQAAPAGGWTGNHGAMAMGALTATSGAFASSVSMGALTATADSLILSSASRARLTIQRPATSGDVSAIVQFGGYSTDTKSWSLMNDTGANNGDNFGLYSATAGVFVLTFASSGVATFSNNVSMSALTATGRLIVQTGTPNSGNSAAYINVAYGNTGDSAAALRMTLNSGIGGLYLGGYSGDTEITHNAEYIAGSGWVARDTVATQIYMSGGTFEVRCNSGLTTGGAFTPSTKFSIATTGAATFSSSVSMGALTGTGNRAVYSDASGTLTNSSSDITLKTSIVTLENCLEKTLALRPVSFNWIDQQRFGPQTEIGMIAQEVQPVVPEVIGTNHDGTLSLDYAKLVALLTGAVQAQQAQIAAQQTQIDTLTAQVALLGA